MWFKSDGSTLVLAITLGFIAASVAEVYFGLAMIIGAFSMGLALSATVLKEYTIFAIRNGGSILVPVFFCIIGMQVDFTALWQSDNLVQLMLFASGRDIRRDYFQSVRRRTACDGNWIWQTAGHGGSDWECSRAVKLR